jgi:hypothetical protein
MAMLAAAYRDLAFCEIDGTLIFLDIANDRYFRLPDIRNDAALLEIDRGGLQRWHQPQTFPKPSDWTVAGRASDAIDSGPFRIADVARALWMQRRAERRLARRGFAAFLAEARQAAESRPARCALSSAMARRTIRAFEQARLLRTAADRCLPRSVALMLCLAACSVRTHIVIGVTLAPFAAHCWVQAGDEVLNDSVEETARYTPILIL